MTRLVIADDHPFLIAGIESILRDTEFQIVGTVTNGQAALDSVSALRPEILLLDVAMPLRNGVDVLRTLRSRGDRHPVVLLTASLDDRQLLEALELGVEGVVLKEGAQALLLDCLRAVRDGGRWIEPSLIQRAIELQSSGAPADPLGALTPRERAITGLVAQGMRNREIGDELGMTEGSVKVYLHRIYEKLGVNNRTELALVSQDRPTRGR
jgi:two-component system nitrate/nitrite response regulator NarL